MKLTKAEKIGIIIALAIFVLFTLSGLEEVPVVAGVLTVEHFKHFAELIIKIVEEV